MLTDTQFGGMSKIGRARFVSQCWVVAVCRSGRTCMAEVGRHTHVISRRMREDGVTDGKSQGEPGRLKPDLVFVPSPFPPRTTPFAAVKIYRITVLATIISSIAGCLCNDVSESERRLLRVLADTIGREGLDSARGGISDRRVWCGPLRRGFQARRRMKTPGCSVSRTHC